MNPMQLWIMRLIRLHESPPKSFPRNFDKNEVEKERPRATTRKRARTSERANSFGLRARRPQLMRDAPIPPKDVVASFYERYVEGLCYRSRIGGNAA